MGWPHGDLDGEPGATGTACFLGGRGDSKEVTQHSAELTALDAKGISTTSPHARLLLDTPRVTETESARADDNARAETELKSILQWLDEGVILFDTQDRVRALNSRFLQVAGLDSSDAAELATLDRLISKLSPSVSDPWSFAQRWRNLARGIDGGIREELEFVRPCSRIVQRLSRPILDPTGRRLGRVEIYRDLTTRRGFQSKLLHTEKLAALGQLITGVAHELNNPLTSILGYSQRLLQKEHTAGSDRELRHIFEEAERATLSCDSYFGMRMKPRWRCAPWPSTKWCCKPSRRSRPACRKNVSAWTWISIPVGRWCTVTPDSCNRC